MNSDWAEQALLFLDASAGVQQAINKSRVTGPA